MMKAINYKKYTDEDTGDIILEFYVNDQCIGSADLEYIDDPHQFIEEMYDTIPDIDDDILNPDDLEGGFYIQDIYINRKYRGNGYFKLMLTEIMRYIDLNKDEYAVTVLRAESDNPVISNEKLAEIYSRYGFSIEQKTAEDGIIMIR